ncbi:RNA polymerase sigma factor [Dyadobacter frigoris]|uniref:RNA polymerase sigma-70 factor n=1 Tax=Dyadobacter frigoris TaxID=2576211 RepID=A0A4U6CYL6_9BACT|nr:RNA polymerase sigma-70 factor [Dyadobacter frigoris]TKT88861.1 RNA polymerase sigma-70 factor [Dyadobacter frigoris]GLU56050.1 DNA-directed RNA polymerase sigma-70 factor [Dyadobacter frigoris]
MQTISMLSDEELVIKLETGEEWAFSEIYGRYWKKMFRHAFSKTGSDDSAKEIVQDIFLDLWQRRGSTHIQELERYLFRAVKYQVLDSYNKQIIRKRHFETVWAKSYEEVTESVEDQMAFEELKEKILECISSFPEKTRQIFTLNRMEGKSVMEISSLLHVPERTVEYHITIGLRHLRGHLKDYIISFSVLVISLLMHKG